MLSILPIGLRLTRPQQQKTPQQRGFLVECTHYLMRTDQPMCNPPLTEKSAPVE